MACCLSRSRKAYENRIIAATEFIATAIARAGRTEGRSAWARIARIVHLSGACVGSGDAGERCCFYRTHESGRDSRSGSI